jgi:hypothetical protein
MFDKTGRFVKGDQIRGGASVFSLGPRDLSTDSIARLLSTFVIIEEMGVETGAGGEGGTPARGRRGGDAQRRRPTGRHSNRTADQ